MLGVLIAHGHDLNDLLDNYTLEQWEVMARCVWRHKLTTLAVVAYAVGGDSARDRVPSADREPSTASSADLDDWKNFPGRWNLARKDRDGKIVLVKPKHSRQETERRQMSAVNQLMGVQRLHANPDGDFLAQIDRAAKRDSEG